MTIRAVVWEKGRLGRSKGRNPIDHIAQMDEPTDSEMRADPQRRQPGRGPVRARLAATEEPVFPLVGCSQKPRLSGLTRMARASIISWQAALIVRMR